MKPRLTEVKGQRAWPRPGRTWVAGWQSPPRAAPPRFCALPPSFPPPSSSPRASPISPRGWTRNGGNPREAEAQRQTGGLDCAFCCTAGPLGRCWAPSGASTVLGTAEVKQMPQPGCSPGWGAGSVHPLDYLYSTVSSLAFLGNLSAFVCSSSDSLYLDK